MLKASHDFFRLYACLINDSVNGALDDGCKKSPLARLELTRGVVNLHLVWVARCMLKRCACKKVWCQAMLHDAWCAGAHGVAVLGASNLLRRRAVRGAQCVHTILPEQKNKFALQHNTRNGTTPINLSVTCRASLFSRELHLLHSDLLHRVMKVLTTLDFRVRLTGYEQSAS